MPSLSVSMSRAVYPGPDTPDPPTQAVGALRAETPRGIGPQSRAQRLGCSPSLSTVVEAPERAGCESVR